MRNLSIATLCVLLLCGASWGAGIDLTQAVVVVRPGVLPNAEATAAKVLIEEIEKRTGIRLGTSTSWPEGKPAIAITSVRKPAVGTEGYRLFVDAKQASSPIVWVSGADVRGALFGVGALLRRLDWAIGKLSIQPSLNIATAPAYPIRGHQLGYQDPGEFRLRRLGPCPV